MAYPIRRGYFSEMLFPTWDAAMGVRRFVLRDEIRTYLPRWASKTARVLFVKK